MKIEELLKEMYPVTTGTSKPLFKKTFCPADMVRFAEICIERQNKDLQSQVDKLLEKYNPVIGLKRSKHLTCPYCKSKKIEINHKAQSFRCMNCEEGWAN